MRRDEVSSISHQRLTWVVDKSYASVALSLIDFSLYGVSLVEAVKSLSAPIYLNNDLSVAKLLDILPEALTTLVCKSSPICRC